MPSTELLEVNDQRQAIAKMMDLAHQSLLKTEDQITVDLMRVYQQHVDSLINDLMVMNAEYMTGGEPDFTKWRQMELDTRSAKLIADRMGILEDEATKQLMDGLTDFYKTAYDYTSWGIDQATPPDVAINYNIPSDAFIRSYVSSPWEGEQFSDAKWRIDTKMANRIQEGLTDAIARGDSVRTFAKSIRELTGVPTGEKLVTRPRASAQLYRATMIARTEMIRVARLAQKQTFDDNRDLIEDEVWTAVSASGRTCEHCQDRDGMTRTQIVNGEASDDLEVDPPAHPNCRCFYRPKLKSWKDLLGKYGEGMEDLEHIDEYEMKVKNPQGGGLQKVAVQSFEEWNA
jgi:SPP1 gp7 family putative phage head morphogenesis protein